MFKKPLKIKSNNPVKGSEKKGARDSFRGSFPHLPEDALNELFSNKKEPLNCVKVLTHQNEVVQVYTRQKQPLFFVLQGKIIPTVFLLWRFPELVPQFTTHPQVVSFINSGADLMLPGVVSPLGGGIQEGDVVCVNSTDNRAPFAVGTASQSAFDMSRSSRGKCVSVLHFWGDFLCSLEGFSGPKVELGPPQFLTLEAPIPEEVKEEEEEKSDDELLIYTFLASIKYSKTLQLPVLVSSFFKLQMLPMCPEGANLDLKKTSYKKLKPFLEEMAQSGLITLKELKKGVEVITEINKNHPKYSEFYLKPQERPREPSSKETQITESYSITSNVLPLLGGQQKGAIIDTPTVRKLVTEYVKLHNCQEGDLRLVHPKTDLLRGLCKTEHPLTWEELFEKVFAAMKPCFKVTTSSDSIWKGGKIAPIQMSVSVRSGNKKVTLVDNLGLFGVNINEFAKECQHGAAASTSITPCPPGRKCDQLLVQGNQVVFVHDLLVEKYKIPKRYIRGLELAPKKKK